MVVMGISNGQPELEAVIEEMKTLLFRKSQDYTDGVDRFSNFTKIADMTGLDSEASFKVFLSVKLIRIMELTASGKEPKNESIEDSLLDLANYSVLWLAWRKRQQKYFNLPTDLGPA